MGGVFINYRRGEHTGTVEGLDLELARYFGRDQVFLDSPSLLPGQRYADTLAERVADCDVLLAVLHPGWAESRDEAGVRRLDEPRDWVRREIQWALESGRFVVPVLLDGARMPAASELPETIRALAGRNALRLREAHWAADLAALVAAVEGEVGTGWTPEAAPEAAGRRPGRWLGVLTGLAACALLAGLPAVPQDDDWAGTDVLPYTLTAALMCCALLTAPLVAVTAVRLVRRSVDGLERELHAVRHRTYIRLTWPIGLGVILLGGYGALRGDQGMAVALPLLLVLAVAVARAAVTDIRLRRRDAALWARWPHRLPDRVSGAVLRRALARLHVRLDGMSAPLSREQREKAHWELGDIGGAADRVTAEAGRTRRGWLCADHPWLCALYVLWLALTGGLLAASAVAFAGEGLGTVRRYVVLGAVVLVALVLALATVEISFRHQRRQRRELVRQITGLRAALTARVTELTRPPRTKPTAPAARPEEYAEPD
ncbi:toll/interleukin-1 receptor domain-containing protein [Streptomyces sp. NPDC090106]|uniref:toll/interleukin-1 receptor domain-containing protein n=1 Tax=Streptomyces sp. NPDC090106 TaxID=3365946 RepID=UPI0037F476E2